jgi:YD repeat-containing protein
MNVSTLTRSCPKCGSACPVSSPSCFYCAFSFAPAYRKAISAKLIVGIIVALVFAGSIVMLGMLHLLVVSTGAYQQAIAFASSSPEIQKSLGDGISVRFPAVGFASGSHGSQFTEFSVRLAGSRGSGHLYGVANSLQGDWEFSRLAFVADHAAERIDLAPVRRLPMPSVPSKKIYLIPVGLDPSESLDWAPSYYKAKLGIEVEVLPATDIPSDLTDPKRKQVDSERLVEHLCRSYSEICHDPGNTLIGVTSRDIFIRSFGWRYAENFRNNGRFAIVSSARFHPFSPFSGWNPEWFGSRLQKILTKNIVVLYFDLPLSRDYTSLLSGGQLSGHQVDMMSGSIIGDSGTWDPFLESDDIQLTMYSMPDKPLVWRMTGSHEIFPQTSARIFEADLTLGLFGYRKTDFHFDGDYPLQFTRAYRNLDEHSRPFGIGANDSLDIFLVGQMGAYIDLIFEDGSRIHFDHAAAAADQKGDTYQAEPAGGNPFSQSRATYAAGGWTVERGDGWKFYFPYTPHALGANVTVLTGFSDPAGRNYEMVRNKDGDLLSVTTPSGQWLHFEIDENHRFHSISDSSGRTVTYDYDEAGCLTRATDSQGNEEHYTYDDKAQMLSIVLGSDPPMLVNTYDISGNITSQTLPDGRQFVYHYVRPPGARAREVAPNLITHPNGLLTYFENFENGYIQSLPKQPPK